MPWSRLNSATIQSTTALSKLSPPRWLSPFVAFTSKTPSPSSSTDTSNVPPPRSKTRIVCSAPSLSSPYASAAAVGSLMMRTTLRPAILPASFVASRCALLKYAGTVTTASETVSPRYASASAFSFWRIIALISGGAYSLPAALTRASPFWPFTTSYGTIVISSVTSSCLRPMKRLIEKIVFCGFVTCWRLAGAPTSRWPSFVNATTEGVVRPPSAFGMTVGSPPSSTAMQLLVVPRSMPIVFAIVSVSLRLLLRKSESFYSRSSRSPGDADQGAARDDEGGTQEQADADELGAQKERREADAPQRLRRDERRDDGDAAAVVRLEQGQVGETEAEPGRGEAPQARAEGDPCVGDHGPDEHDEQTRPERRRGGGRSLHVGVDGEPADDVVARGEHERPEGREEDPDRPDVGRPAALADQQEPTPDDQQRADDEAGDEGLAEEHERDRDGEERRRADGHGGPRGARVA